MAGFGPLRACVGVGLASLSVRFLIAFGVSAFLPFPVQFPRALSQKEWDGGASPEASSIIRFGFKPTLGGF